MINNNKPDAVKFGDLFSGENGLEKLFYTPFSSRSSSDKKPIDSRSKAVQKPSKVRLISVFPDKVPNYIQKAVYPFISKEAFSITMDNYRLHIAQYNRDIEELNDNIQKHNHQVEKNIEVADEVQKVFRAEFLKKHGSSIKCELTFNELADEFNEQRGILIEKRKIQKVKFSSEKVFEQIVHIYASQLHKYTTEYIKLGVAVEDMLRKVDLNAQSITQLQRNGELSIDVHKQTIRNHRKRLEAAGVLTNYNYRGHKKGIQHHINPKILVFLDAKTNTLSNVENQSVTVERFKIVKDNNVYTRTINNNINKRENGKTDFQVKGTPAANPFIFLQEHSSARKESKLVGGEKNVKISNYLMSTIENRQELAEKLTAKEYDDYTPINLSTLHHEAMYGTISREYFNEIIIQDFFKMTAKYYTKHNVFAGSWKKAINSWIENRFTYNNGNGIHLCNKQLMVYQLEQFRWRMKNSENFYRKTKIGRLFPSDYFDFTRTTKQEIGFEYTATSWKKHLEYLDNQPKQKTRLQKKAAKRKANINHSKKFETKFKQLKNDKISYSEMYNYTKDNLPANFMIKLAERIKETVKN